MVEGYNWRAEKEDWGRAWLGAMMLTAVTGKAIRPSDLMAKDEKPEAPAKTREETLADLRKLDEELNAGLGKKRT